eukprot:2918912-Alexandrium_andersonii.AAC.1
MHPRHASGRQNLGGTRCVALRRTTMTAHRTQTSYMCAGGAQAFRVFGWVAARRCRGQVLRRKRRGKAGSGENARGVRAGIRKGWATNKRVQAAG